MWFFSEILFFFLVSEKLRGFSPFYPSNENIFKSEIGEVQFLQELGPMKDPVLNWDEN